MTPAAAPPPAWWMELHARVAGAGSFCFLRSRAPRHGARIDAFCDPAEPVAPDRPGVDPGEVSFAPAQYQGPGFNAFMSLSAARYGTRLLVPPYPRLAARDVEHFARLHGEAGWAELWRALDAEWRAHPESWVSTEGHAVPYLHLRLEPGAHFPHGPRYDPQGLYRRL